MCGRGDWFCCGSFTEGDHTSLLHASDELMAPFWDSDRKGVGRPEGISERPTGCYSDYSQIILFPLSSVRFDSAVEYAVEYKCLKSQPGWDTMCTLKLIGESEWGQRVDRFRLSIRVAYI